MAVLGNVETVSRGDETLKGLMDYLEAVGQVRSAMQYQHLLEAVDISRPEGLELTLKDSEISRNASKRIEKSAKSKTKMKKSVIVKQEEKKVEVNALANNGGEKQVTDH